MVFYTVQSQGVIPEIIKNKKFISNPKYATFPEQYAWMYKQLRKRVPKLKNPSKSLIWLLDCIPDLSCGWGLPGSKMVLLKVELPTEYILCSSFEAWDILLLNQPLEYEEKCQNVNLHKSWEHVFDLKWCYDYYKSFDDDYELPDLDKQYVTGEIPIENISIVKFFTAN